MLTALKGEMTIIIASHFEELIKMSDMHVNIDSQDVNQSNVEGQQSGQKLRTSKVGGTAHG